MESDSSLRRLVQRGRLSWALCLVLCCVLGNTGCAHRVVLSGSLNAPPVGLSCSASPVAVYPGDPVVVSGMAAPDGTDYQWTASGGARISGQGSTATVETGGLAAGSYTVSGRVTTNGAHPVVVSCKSEFTVKAFEPPTVSCSVSPDVVRPGESATVTAMARSPQNRALTYSYRATAGQIAGAGTTATLSTAGAAAGPLTITCQVADEQGQIASATTSVTLLAASVAALPQATPLCAIRFDHAPTQPAGLDQEAKACLDVVALELKEMSDASLLIVGSAATGEKDGADVAAKRALAAAEYLVQHGVDRSRMQEFRGQEGAKADQMLLLPAGASTPAGLTPMLATESLNVGHALATGRLSGAVGARMAGCTGLGVLISPAKIDLTLPGLPSQRFTFFLSRFADAVGSGDGLRKAICGVVKPDDPTCLTDAEWQKATSSCGVRDAQALEVTGGSGNYGVAAYPVRAMEGTGVLPATVQASLSPPNGVDCGANGEDDCTLTQKTGAFFSTFEWKYVVSKEAPNKGDAQGLVRLTLKDGDGNKLMNDASANLTLVYPSALLSDANNALRREQDTPLGNLFKSFWTWLFSGVTGTAALAWFWRTFGPKKKKEKAPAPVVAQAREQSTATPAEKRPVVVVVQKPPESAAGEGLAGTPRRTRSRSRHQGRNGDS